MNPPPPPPAPPPPPPPPPPRPPPLSPCLEGGDGWPDLVMMPTPSCPRMPAGLAGRHVTLDDVQIGAADCGFEYAHDGIGGVEMSGFDDSSKGLPCLRLLLKTSAFMIGVLLWKPKRRLCTTSLRRA